MLSPGLMTAELGFNTRLVSGRGGAVLAGWLGGGGADPPPLLILDGGGDEGGPDEGGPDEGGPDEGGPDEGGPVLFVGFTRKVAVPVTCPCPTLTVAVTVCGPAFVAVQVGPALGQKPSGEAAKAAWPV